MSPRSRGRAVDVSRRKIRRAPAQGPPLVLTLDGRHWLIPMPAPAMRAEIRRRFISAGVSWARDGVGDVVDEEQQRELFSRMLGDAYDRLTHPQTGICPEAVQRVALAVAVWIVTGRRDKAESFFNDGETFLAAQRAFQAGAPAPQRLLQAGTSADRDALDLTDGERSN